VKNLRDTFQVGYGAREEDGTKLEPEQQPVRRVIESEASVTVGEAVLPQTIPLMVTAEMEAREAEALLSSQCQFCVHWRQDEFRKDRGGIARIDLDRMRAQALDCAEIENVNLSDEQIATADPILDAVIGKCMALSSLCTPEPIYTHREAGCPSSLPNGIPLENLFQPIPDAKRIKSAVRDRMMRRAQGRIA